MKLHIVAALFAALPSTFVMADEHNNTAAIIDALNQSGGMPSVLATGIALGGQMDATTRAEVLSRLEPDMMIDACTICQCCELNIDTFVPISTPASDQLINELFK